jgi:cytosine/adenosine deaminase-related metal-dependent hydrolase
MEGRLVFKDCALVRADGRAREGMAVVVEEGRIRRVALDAEVPALPGDWAVACRGRVLAPGRVDCHAHLVGRQLLPRTGELLLRGPASLLEAYARLEAALTPSEVEALTAHALAQGLLEGLTLRVEHLRAPMDTAGALEAQARAARALGSRVLLAPAPHLLDGESGALGQLETAAAFAAQERASSLVRGALGFHASSTSPDTLLRRVGRLREEAGLPVVFHLAESEEDMASTFTRHGWRGVPRLDAFGLLGRGAVAAGARAVDRPAELCSLLFGAPSGAVEEGALADLVLYDALVPQPEEGMGGAWRVRELGRAHVAWTVVEGRVVVREGQLLGGDALELAHEAARALRALWRRVLRPRLDGAAP